MIEYEVRAQTPITLEFISGHVADWLRSFENKAEQMAAVYEIFGHRGPDVLEYLLDR